MKEDYLWDKTGQDFEIERLENALQMFRYKETAPPALPAKIIPFEKKYPRRTLQLAFAFAACAAFVIVTVGIWLHFSPKKTEVAEDSFQPKKTELAKDSAETIAPHLDGKNSDEIPIKKQDDLIVEKVEIPKQAVQRNIVRIRKIVPLIARQNVLIARNIEAKKPAVKLTKEEKYAYDQLMLALSITSSKLKLVTDKIDGGEEQNVVLKNER